MSIDAGLVNIDPGLVAWMVAADREAGFRHDLLSIRPRGGAVLRWTSGDRSVMTTDGRVFQVGPGIERGKLRMAAGLQVDDMDLSLLVDDTVMMGGLPALTFAERGGLDGADVQLEWAYFDTDGTFMGRMTRFTGMTGPAEFEMGRIDLLVRSEISRLNISVPQEVYQPSCHNQVFDPRCGLNPAAFLVSGEVTAVGTGRQALMQLTTDLVQADGYFDIGLLEFTSGVNNGLLRTVKRYASGVCEFALPLQQEPSIGDTFTVLPGCNRTLPICVTRFNNRGRFRGTPFIPDPETVA